MFFRFLDYLSGTSVLSIENGGYRRRSYKQNTQNVNRRTNRDYKKQNFSAVRTVTSTKFGMYVRDILTKNRSFTYFLQKLEIPITSRILPLAHSVKLRLKLMNTRTL